jgi:hypothetical protein
MALSDINGRGGPWSGEGLMAQHRGMLEGWEGECRCVGVVAPSQRQRGEGGWEQRLKKVPYGDRSTWGSILSEDTKPRHYCCCQEVLTDRNLVWLLPVRFCQDLTNTDVDARSHPSD